MTSPAGAADPEARYRARLSRFVEAGDRESRRSDRLGRARVAVFAAGLLLLGAAEAASGAARGGLLAGGLAALAGFGVLVRRHRAVREEARRLDVLARLNRDGLARLAREWEALPAGEGGDAPEGHPYAADLDVFGPASLRALLGTVATAPGARTLRRWLLGPAPPDEVAERQRAVAELAGRLDYRQELAARALLDGLRTGDDFERLLGWGEGDPVLGERDPLRWVAWILPAATVGLLAAHLAGAIGYPWWILGVAAAIAVSALRGPAIHAAFDRLSTRAERFRSYAGVLGHLPEVDAASPHLRLLRDAVGAGREGAAFRLRELESLAAAADVRHNGMMHFPLQVLFLWDFHVLRRLERWRAAHGAGLRRWMEALGEIEALAALAALRADHPSWSFPGPGDGEPARYRAEGLGHPLLRPALCVANDVELGPPGTFLLVTGSNMSGKSTLLRAIGLNAVLAGAGGPVCARRLRMPSVEVWTSMRVEDSLAAGVSQFLAEVRRVARVVRAADAPAGGEPGSPGVTADPAGQAGPGAAAGSGAWAGPGASAGSGASAGPGASAGSGGWARPVLYLLDEPLRGTNETERREALRLVLRRLLDAPAIGAVATHDLQVHRAAGLEEAAHVVHLRGTVRDVGGRPRLEFDYRLRPGPATTTNALELLRMEGIGPDGTE